MKKLIDFKTLKSICGFEYPIDLDKTSECDHEENEKNMCTERNCPIWKKLKEPESFTRTIKITKPYLDRTTV